MASVKRFEDLYCWQKARELVNQIYNLTSKKTFTDYSLKDQLQRAAVSVLSNIAEGFERGTKEEFLYFLYIAKGSCGEVRAQLYVALDQKFITMEEFRKASELAKEVSSVLYKFIESLKGSKFKGLRHKEAEKEDIAVELAKKYTPEYYEKHLRPR